MYFRILYSKIPIGVAKDIMFFLENERKYLTKKRSAVVSIYFVSCFND